MLFHLASFLFPGLACSTRPGLIVSLAMSAELDTFAVRNLRRLADLLYHRPDWIVWPQIVLFIVAAGGTWSFLKPDLDRKNLVGAERRYHRNFQLFKKEFPVQDDLVAVVESEDHEKNRQFIERLGARLESHSTTVHPTNLLTDVFFKGELKLMGRKALLFVPERDLEALSRTIAEYRPFIQQFAGASNLATLFGSVNHQIRTAKREASAANESMVRALPALERIIRRANESLGKSGFAPSPGIDALFGAGPEAERAKYITFDHGRIYIATAKARLAALGPDAVALFRRLLDETHREVPGVNVGITGEPVLEYDEMQQSQHDSTLATILSLVIVAIIFVFGYGEIGRPMKAVLCLVIGLGYTLGYTTLVIGHLNILTITFVPMLIGLAIDFGIHLITRYEEELRLGQSPRDAMEKAVVNTGNGIFTGCFTTAGAFFAMALTGFKGIQEMGIITGGGMLICLVPMMTLLPVLLLRRSRQNAIVPLEARTAATPPASPLGEAALDSRARFERLWLDRPWTVIGVVFVLCLLSIARFPVVFFDYNLLNMQSPRLDSVIFERKLIRSSERSVLYGAMVANSLSEAHQIEEKLRALPSVLTNDSMAKYLGQNATGKLAQVARIRSAVSGFQFGEPDLKPVEISELSNILWSLQGYLGLIADDLRGDTNQSVLLANALSLRETLGTLRYAMQQGRKSENAVRLGHFQQALFADLRDTFETLRTQDSSSGLQADDLPLAMRHRFIGINGKHLIQIYPRRDAWQRDAQEEFVRELRTVDPDVTGTPVQLLEYTSLLMTSYVEAAGWALAAIVLLVYIHFRRVLSVILSLLPVVIGAIWMIGFMGWTGIPFNPANIMTLPLVIGIGVTNGIHILNRFAEEKNPSILAKSTGKAVFVSGLTTIAGFGSLLIAEHPGIRSLGAVMAVGTTTCMVAGLTFLPALLTLLNRRRNP